MTKSTLTTKGFDEYLEKLAQAGADINEITNEALQAGAEVIKNGMLRRAPMRSGKLRSHIKIKGPVQDGNFHSIKIGVLDVDRVRETYFFYQEMGSARTSAHPYIRPAWDEDKSRARAEMIKVFKEQGAL